MKTINFNISKLIPIFLLILFIIFPLISQAAVITVPGDYSTIQAAIDAAIDGDEIIVSPGTYNEHINWGGKNIVLRSTDPTSASIVANTIIDGNNSDSVVTFSGWEGSACVLSGFTITHGHAEFGGGILGYGTLATIQYNIISNNSADYGGGILWCDGTIQYNSISGNSALKGGSGLYDCEGLIQYNEITSNSATKIDTPGGGLAYCDGTIRSNTISGNSAYYGGGVIGCQGVIQDNTISGNSADYGGGLMECNGTVQYNTISDNFALNAGGGLYNCDAAIQNNDITSNSTTAVIDTAGGGLAFCDGAIQNNTIADNSAYFGGGLILCHGTIQNNTIVGNSACCGGGISDCDGTIQYNTVSANTANEEGGGLHACDGIIQYNDIFGNSTTDYCAPGGGLGYCNATIQFNSIYRNSADFGAGLAVCQGTIQNNTIYENSATYIGGGFLGCDERVQNNIIFGNSAGDNGGGLNFCNGSIVNNTVCDNFAGSAGGGLYDCDNAIIANCIIWQNSAPSGPNLRKCSTPSYCCIQDWTGGGTGNISSDPELVDPANGNFHLLSTSPCIDAGCAVSDLFQDFEGDPRPMDGTSEPRGDGSDYDIGADEFPGEVQEYNFDLTNEEWTSVTISSFTPPNCYCQTGQIVLTAQDNTNTFGYWSSGADAVPVAANSLYRASWTVSTDVTDPLAVPQMRLRANSQNLQQADVLVVSSAGDGSYAPTPEGRTYEMYFVPPESCLGKPEDQDDLVLSFDILNFDPSDAANGSLMLDRVVVDAIHLDTLSTPTLLKTWSFDTDAEGWQFGTAPVFTAPASDISGGALWLIAQDNTSTFGFWGGPAEEVQAQAGKLYRLRFSVSTDVTNQIEVPQLRLRVSSEDFQSSIVKAISSVTGAEMSPTSAGRSYDLYFYPPQSLIGTESDSILVTFDMLNFDPADASTGALLLDTVTVESLSAP